MAQETEQDKARVQTVERLVAEIAAYHAPANAEPAVRDKILYHIKSLSKELGEKPVPPGAPPRPIDTLLWEEVVRNHPSPEMIECLLRANANPHAIVTGHPSYPNSEGRTCLTEGYSHFSQACLRYVKQIDTPDGQGWTALDNSVKARSWDAMHWLHKAGADMNRRGQDGLTPFLRYAADPDSKRLTVGPKRLLEAGADTQATYPGTTHTAEQRLQAKNDPTVDAPVLRAIGQARGAFHQKKAEKEKKWVPKDWLYSPEDPEEEKDRWFDGPSPELLSALAVGCNVFNPCDWENPREDIPKVVGFLPPYWRRHHLITLPLAQLEREKVKKTTPLESWEERIAHAPAKACLNLLS